MHLSPATMPETVSLEISYAHCRAAARSAARNFYYGFRLLPAAKRDALCALYAFMRGVDDISDEPGELACKRERLAERRAQLDRVLMGHVDGNAIWPAFRHTVTHYGIPTRYLHDLISGAEMDLTTYRYETFQNLREYSYRVAGTVGLSCVSVFGFTDAKAVDLAERLGIAFQLTNVLRDVAADFKMGRVYLPQEDFRRFGCSEEDLQRLPQSAALREMIHFEARRTRQFYREGMGLMPLVSKDSQAALWALARIYFRILEKIEARNYDVLSGPPARLSAAQKLWILGKAQLGLRDSRHVA